MYKELIEQQEKWDKFTRLLENIDSSTVQTIGGRGMDLFIKFKSNNRWYMAMGAGIEFDDIAFADSVGKYWHSTIKTQYPVYEIMEDGSTRITN